MKTHANKGCAELFSTLDAMDEEKPREQGRRLLVMASEADLEELACALLEWGGTDAAKATDANGRGFLEFMFI